MERVRGFHTRRSRPVDLLCLIPSHNRGTTAEVAHQMLIPSRVRSGLKVNTFIWGLVGKPG